MKASNFIFRKGKFDAGHRIMHEHVRCFNIHGHEFRYTLNFKYETTLEIGYPIDFKELKRIGCQWIKDNFDHAFIANPKDEIMLQACKELGSKLYIMNLVDHEGFCNPSAENIAKEIFYAVSMLLNNDNLKLEEFILCETLNCCVSCRALSPVETAQLDQTHLYQSLKKYKKEKGSFEYDERKLEKLELS